MNDPVPDTNGEVWLERNQLLGEYLPRIGASPDFVSQKILACELAGKLFDSWAGHRIRDLKSPADLPAFEKDQDAQAIMIERSYLSDIAVFILADNSVDLTIAGRKRHWYAEAVRRLGTGGKTHLEVKPTAPMDVTAMASDPAPQGLSLRLETARIAKPPCRSIFGKSRTLQATESPRPIFGEKPATSRAQSSSVGSARIPKRQRPRINGSPDF